MMVEKINTELHPIRVAARRTGLTPHVLRAWEKRYGAVKPSRSEGGRRLYSNQDLERLLLLRRATLGGRSIGQVAGLSDEELLTLVSEDEDALAKAPSGEPYGLEAKETSQERGPGPQGPKARFHLEACLKAIEQLEAKELDENLARAAVALSRPMLIEDVLLPLMRRVGELWQEGTLRVVHEHLASSVVRSFLGAWWENAEAHPTAPVLVAATPAGQLHELGALIAAASASSEGWNAVYLGPNLPAEEIARAAEHLGAKAVALSVVYPPDDPHLRHELLKLHRSLPQGAFLMVGGRAAQAYGDVLDKIGAELVGDFRRFRERLEAVRLQGAKYNIDQKAAEALHGNRS